MVPGGKVEPGETLNAAVHREIKEETNLNIDVIKKLGSIRNNKYKLHWFVCAPTDLSLLKVVEPLKQKELKWIDLNDSSINWTPKNREALMKYKKQISNIQKAIYNVYATNRKWLETLGGFRHFFIFITYGILVFALNFYYCFVDSFIRRFI